VQGVVITAKAKDESLFRGCLVFDDPVWTSVLGYGLGLWRTSNEFRKLFTGSFGPEIEGCTLSVFPLDKDATKEFAMDLLTYSFA
jgi:hypothetical protein